MADYSDFIEWLLQKENIEYSSNEKWFHHGSFFTEDKHKSCIFFRDGTELIYNEPIDGRNRFKIKEIVKMLGYLDEFILWCMEQLNIPSYKLNYLREECGVYDCKYESKYKKDLYPLVKNFYLSYDEIINGCLVKPIEFTIKKKKVTKNERPASNRKPNYSEYSKILQYMNSRDLEVRYNCFPDILILPSGIEILGVCLLYPNGYRKYRLLKGDLRYLSTGKYEELFEVRQEENNKILCIVEGEIEAITFSKLIDSSIDIMALHNASTLRTSLNLNKYDKIIILIDKDKFEESKKVIEKDLTKMGINAIISYKVDNEKEDFNSLYCKGKHEEIVKNINKILRSEI